MGFLKNLSHFGPPIWPVLTNMNIYICVFMLANVYWLKRRDLKQFVLINMKNRDCSEVVSWTTYFDIEMLKSKFYMKIFWYNVFNFFLNFFFYNNRKKLGNCIFRGIWWHYPTVNFLIKWFHEFSFGDFQKCVKRWLKNSFFLLSDVSK